MIRVFVCAAVFALSGAACASDELEKLLVVNGAYELQKRTFTDSDAHHVYYKVDLKYPEAAIGARHFEILQKRGWAECTGGSKEWDSYPEITEDKAFGVHQKLTYWAKGERLLTIGMRYYSGLSKDKKHATLPDNHVQYVFIIVAGDKDLQTKHLKISCPR